MSKKQRQNIRVGKSRNRKSWIMLIAVLSALAVSMALLSCGGKKEEAPKAAAPKAAAQKTAVPTPAPATPAVPSSASKPSVQGTANAPAAPSPATPDASTTQKAPAASAPTGGTAPPAPATPSTPATTAAPAAPGTPEATNVPTVAGLDVSGQRDPFKSFIDQLGDMDEGEEGEEAAEEDDVKGVDYTGAVLRKFELRQLKLVGVIIGLKKENIAMVEDPTGKGYLVKLNTPIGRRGRVTEINFNEMKVTEKFKNFLGEEKTEEHVIKLKSSGEGE